MILRLQTQRLFILSVIFFNDFDHVFGFFGSRLKYGIGLCGHEGCHPIPTTLTLVIPPHCD